MQTSLAGNATPTTRNSPRGSQIQAFYTRTVDKCELVKLFVNKVKTPGHPHFDGIIGDNRVAIWIREKEGKKFLSIYGSVKNTSGNLPPLGTARLVVTDRGIPKLAIRMTSNRGKPQEVIWATASKGLHHSILESAGLNLNVLAFRKKSVMDEKLKKMQGQNV